MEVNGFAAQNVASENGVYAATYQDHTTSVKHVRIANYNPADLIKQENLITERSSSNNAPTYKQVTDATCPGTVHLNYNMSSTPVAGTDNWFGTNFWSSVTTNTDSTAFDC